MNLSSGSDEGGRALVRLQFILSSGEICPEDYSGENDMVRVPALESPEGVLVRRAGTSGWGRNGMQYVAELQTALPVTSLLAHYAQQLIWNNLLSSTHERYLCWGGGRPEATDESGFFDDESL